MPLEQLQSLSRHQENILSWNEHNTRQRPDLCPWFSRNNDESL